MRSTESLERRAEYNHQWWLKNGSAYNRAHPRRSQRPPSISRIKVLREDIEQQRVLARLSHRKVDDPEAYGRRERHWIFQSSISIVTYDEAEEGEGIQL